MPEHPIPHNFQFTADMDIVLLCALAKQPPARFGSIFAFANSFSQALQSIEPPTIIKSLPSPVSNDLHVTLAISELEALHGTQRRLTLPGGRQVTVSVPANAYDGQLIRLDGLGESVGIPGSAGTLILTLNVKHTTEATTPSNPGNSNLTMPASNPNLSHTIAVPDQPQVQQPVKRRSSSGGKVLVLLLLVILLILGSVGFLLYTNVKNQQAFNAANTATAGSLNNGATAQVNTATAQAIANATSQTNAVATAKTSTQATAQANAQATAQANIIATAQANATATTITAQANATATANAGNSNPDPYPPYGGTLGLNDPL